MAPCCDFCLATLCVASQGVVHAWMTQEAAESQLAHLMLGFPLDLYQVGLPSWVSIP